MSVKAGAFIAVWAVLISAGAADQAGDDQTQRIRNEYLAVLGTTRQTMLARPEARHPLVRAQALYALESMQAGAFHFCIAPRPDYPNFYREAIWSPYESTWGGPAADFVYQWTFLDGARSYRITGKRGTTRFVDFQLWDGYWNGSNSKSLGNYDLDKFNIASDGSFEILLSAQPQPGNWIRLDPNAHDIVVQVRDAFYDWEHEQRVRMAIEALDRHADSMALSEDELNRRIEKAGQLVRTGISMALGLNDRVKREAGGSNKFIAIRGKRDANSGASPRAEYFPMDFELQQDEALIIESDVPQAKYWSIQLTDLWWQTLDFSFHQSGLNGRQARIDSDGKFRAVLSLKDPGVANWLDPVGTPVGQLMMRTYDAAPLALPKVTRVKFDQLRKVLPKDTPTLDPERRAEQIASRARASLSRWGN